MVQENPKLHVVDLEVQESGELTIAWTNGPGHQRRVVGADAQERIAHLVAALKTAEDKRDPRLIAEPRLELGQELYRLLDGDGDRVLAQRWQAATQQGQPLRVVVRLLGPELAQHPAVGWRWELLAEDQRHLCLGIVQERIDLAVQLGRVLPKKPSTLPTGQLRILFMAFSPEDTRPVLDYEAEEEAFLEALATHQEQGRVQLRVVEEGNLKALERALARSAVDIVHLSGHGKIAANGPRLAMENELGDCTLVGAEELERALEREPPRLVVISCCHSTEGGGGFPSLAAELVAAGVESVIGWVRPVLDDVATQAARDFYDQLCRGRSDSEAVGFARNALRKADEKASKTGRGFVTGAWGTLQSIGRDGAGFRLDTSLEADAEPTASELAHGYLGGSGKVRILEEGFVGRRRELQRLVRLLRTGKSRDGQRRAGALVWGMKGVGKSCLVGRAVVRHVEDVGSGHGLVVLHGRIDEAQLLERFTAAAVQLQDDEAEALLQRTDLSVAQRIGRLLASRWSRKRVVIILDDFEQNLTEQVSGPALVEPSVAELLAALLPPCRDGAPALLVTSTACFALPSEVEEALAPVELGSLELASVRKLWVRGRGKKGELHGVRQEDWETLAERFGRNARVLDWARQLFGGSTPAEVLTLLNEGEAPPKGWKNGAASEEAQAELAAVYLRSLAFSRAEAEVGEEARTFVERARVYDRPVPRSALSGLTAGLSLDLDAALPALSNLGLLEVGRQREERVWRVSPLVVPELRAGGAERWHGVAAEHWERAAETNEGWSVELTFLCWEHSLAARDEHRASRMGRMLKMYLFQQGAYQRSAELARRHAAAFPNSVLGLHWVGSCERNLGRVQGGLETMKQAMCRAESVEVDQVYLQSLHHDLAMAHQAQGELPAAREALECSLEIQEGLARTQSSDYAASLHQLAGVLRAQGDLPKARKLLERSLDIKRQVLGTELHPEYAASLHALAAVLQTQGDLPEARKLLERSLDIQRQVLGTELHPSYSASLHQLAGVLKAQGNLPEARKLLERSLDIDRQVLGTELHPEYAASVANLAGLEAADGRLEQAITLARQVMSIQGKVFGTFEHPNVAENEMNLAAFLIESGQQEEGQQHAQHAIAVLKRMAPNHPILQQLGMAGGPTPSEGGLDFAPLFQATLAARAGKQVLPDEMLELLDNMAEAGDVPAAIASFLRTVAQPGQRPVIPEGLPEELTVGLRQATEVLIQIDAQLAEANGS
ncbi:MAG: tetratricopeptide repeat protein [Acidobacteriota bacterium]